MADNKKSLAAELSQHQGAGYYVRPHAVRTAPGFFTHDPGPKVRGLHPRSKLRGIRPIGNKLTIVLTALIFLSGARLSAIEYINRFIPVEYSAQGDTFVTITAGAAGVWLNPAGLAQTYSPELKAGFAKWLGDLNQFMGSAAIPLPLGTIGVGVGWLGLPPLQMEDETGNYLDQTLRFEHLVFSLAYGLKLLNIPLGISLKYSDSRVGLDRSSCFLVEAGGVIDLKILKVGLIAHNLEFAGFERRFNGEFRAGVSRKFNFYNVFSLEPAADFFFSATYMRPGFHMGVDLGYKNLAHLRFGFAPEKMDAFSAGLGLTYSPGKWRVSLDYGINPAMSGTRSTHFVEVTVVSTSGEIRNKVSGYMSSVTYSTTRKDYKTAIAKIDEAIKVSPEDKELLRLRGELAVRLAGQDFESLQVRVAGLTNAGDYQKASAEIDEFLVRYPDHQAAAGLKAGVMAAANRMAVAESLASVEDLIKLKKYQEAKQELEKARALSPADPVVLSRLGFVSYEMGDLKAAGDYYQKVLKVAPGSAEAKEKTRIILAKIEEQKPIWLKQDQYYSEQSLVFEDFQEDLFVSKFLAVDGTFDTIHDGKDRYGRFTFEASTNGRFLRTSIRLPDLSKFGGVKLTLRSEGAALILLVLTEQQGSAENLWQVEISDVERQWKTVMIPFRYFQLMSDPAARLDLGKIIRFMFEVPKGSRGTVDIDSIEFYK